MSESFEAPPYIEGVVDAHQIMTGKWVRWLSLFFARVLGSVQRVGVPVSTTTSQSAAISTTTLLAATQGGTYRVSWYIRITVSDGVSSLAQLTVTWREGSQTCSKTFTALTGDTVTTFDSAIWAMHADSGTLITYAIAYASNTPLKMRYRADIAVEQLN